MRTFVPTGLGAIGGFADLWLYSDSDYRSRQPHRRDDRACIVATFACPICGVAAGVPCQRATVSGRSVVRASPHFERGSAFGGGPVKRTPERRRTLSRAQRAAVYREYWKLRAARAPTRGWFARKARELGVLARSVYRAAHTKPRGEL